MSFGGRWCLSYRKTIRRAGIRVIEARQRGIECGVQEWAGVPWWGMLEGREASLELESAMDSTERYYTHTIWLR